jgi:TonB family protein
MLTVPRAPTRNLLQIAECVLASSAFHVGLIVTLALATRDANGLPESSRSIVPLFLVPPKRTPEIPRESRLPILAPLGNEFGTGNAMVAAGKGGPDLYPGGTVGHQSGWDGDPGLRLPGKDAATLDSVYSVIMVDSAVVFYPESAAPEYPQELLEQGVEGEVFAEFVVDTTGSVDRASIRIVDYTHQAFMSSVKETLPRMLFRPAIRNQRRVRQLVQQHFRFQIQRPAVSVS